MPSISSLTFTGLAAFALLTGGASAQGMTSYSNQMYAPAPVHDWSGFYVGAFVGAGMHIVDQQDYWCWYACDAPTLSEWSAQFGGTVGAQMQQGSLVYGVEADVSNGFSHERVVMYDISDDDGVRWSASWDALMTLRGRAGLAVDRTLVFGTAGLAIAHTNYSAKEIDAGDTDCSTDDCASYSGWQAGLAVGGGIEHALTENISIKGEYLGVFMPTVSDRWNTADPDSDEDFVSWAASSHTVRAGVNYSF